MMKLSGLVPGVLLLILIAGGCKKKKTPVNDDSQTNSFGATIVAPPGGAEYWTGGWNPGFKFRRAATHIPGSPLYFESCPDAPGGSCASLGRGNGFFTLAHDQFPEHALDGNNCRINSGAPYSPRSVGNPSEASPNPNVPCPYRFFWGVNAQPGPDNGKNYARLVVDTSSFPNPITRNNYLGLQENFIGKRTDFLLGLNPATAEHAMPASQVHSRRFKIRTKFCRLGGAGDPFFAARFVHYLNFTKYGADGKVTNHKSIALNFQSIRIAPPGTPTSAQHFIGDPQILNEGVWSSSLGSSTPDFNTWHIDSVQHIGFPSPSVYQDDHTGCATPIEAVGWTDVEVPVAGIIQNLQKRGILSANDIQGAVYSAGIVAGIESWGRGFIEMDILGDQVIMKKTPTAAAAPGTGQPYYCDFNTGVLVERPTPSTASWKKIVGCVKPGITPATVELEGVGCKIENRLGVFNGSTYLCVRSAGGVPAAVPQLVGAQGPGYYQGPVGRYYFNGTNAFCWFAGNTPDGSTLIPTTVEPSGAGYRNDGRCPFDLK